MKQSPQEQRLRQMRAMWEWRSTEDLLDVWKQNNRSEWTDEAFEVIGQILLDRLGIVPPQDEVAIAPSRPAHATKWIILAVTLIALFITSYVLFFRSKLAVQVWRDETQTISLTRSLNPKRLVYENDIVQISIGHDQFLDYIAAQLRDPETTSAMQEYYKEWRAKVDLELSRSDVMLLNERQIEYFVATMLEIGQAAVLDKRSHSYVRDIKWRTYNYTCGLNCCGEFYYFYLPTVDFFNPNGTQFLELQHGIC